MGACADHFADCDEASVVGHFAVQARDCVEAGDCGGLVGLRGSARATARGVPLALVVRSPNGQGSCEGVYTLAVEAAGRPQGMPVWRNDKCRWLYSSTVGTWSIGGSRARSSNFTNHSAHIFSHIMHDGAMPDQVPGTWWRAEGQHFTEDLDVVVTAVDRCCGGQPAPLQDCHAEEATVLLSGAGSGAAQRTRATASVATTAASQSWTPPGPLRGQSPVPEPLDLGGVPDREPKAPLVPEPRSSRPHALDICFQSSRRGRKKEVLVTFKSTPLGLKFDFTSVPAVVLCYEPHLKAAGLRKGMAMTKIGGLDATRMMPVEVVELIKSESSRLPSRRA